MRYAVSLSFFASPALAHPGAHLHPQEAAPAIMLLAIPVIAAGALLAWRFER